MTPTIFIKHPITDEESLPPAGKEYFVIDKTGFKHREYLHKLDNFENKRWIADFAFWLEEKPLPSEEEIENYINKTMNDPDCNLIAHILIKDYILNLL